MGADRSAAILGSWKLIGASQSVLDRQIHEPAKQKVRGQKIKGDLLDEPILHDARTCDTSPYSFTVMKRTSLHAHDACERSVMRLVKPAVACLRRAYVLPRWKRRKRRSTTAAQ